MIFKDTSSLHHRAWGWIGLTDKSPAEEIYDTFGVSKKTFKKAVGDLYKKRLILLQEDGIELVRP